MASEPSPWSWRSCPSPWLWGSSPCPLVLTSNVQFLSLTLEVLTALCSVIGTNDLSTIICELRNVRQQVQGEIEKEETNLKSAQTATLEKLRQNLDQQFVKEQSRLKCVFIIPLYEWLCVILWECWSDIMIMLNFSSTFIECCGNISVKLWVCWVLCLPLTKIAMFLW